MRIRITCKKNREIFKQTNNIKNDKMSKVNFFRTRPQVIQAMEYDGSNTLEIAKFIKEDGDFIASLFSESSIVVKYNDNCWEVYEKESFNKNFEKV